MFKLIFTRSCRSVTRLQVIGKVGNKVQMAMRIGPLSHAAALCDDVATVDCFCTDIGRIPGTEKTCAEGGCSASAARGC